MGASAVDYSIWKIDIFVLLNYIRMTAFKVGSKWKGYFDAPLPYGRRDFSCEITEMTDKNSFVGEGEDADGKFSIKGSLCNFTNIMENGQEWQICEINFVKDYLADDGYKGIQYKGTMNREKITGEYSFLWKKAFLSKTVTGNF